MATRANEESSDLRSERYCKDRYSAYKKLLADLAQHLGPEDVKVIAFNCSLPESLKQSSALDVLDYLDKHARFSPINIQPLAELLTAAYRNDLVNDYVERYGLIYGRHSSVPSPRCTNKLQAARRRAVYSSPGTCPPVQETGDFSPENNPFSRTEDTLHEDESACSQSSNEPPQPPPVLPFSHPQTLTVTNYAHPKTVHQFNDQMQPGAMKSELQTPQGASNQTRENIMPPVTAPLHFRQTSTPTQVHQARRFHNHSGTTTPGSVSSSSSMHEMNNYHNPGYSEQDMLYSSSAASANASQDLLSAQPTTQLEHSLSSTHIRSREHHLWYHTQASSQGSLLSEQALGNFPPQISNQASQYPTENSLQLSYERLLSKPTHHSNGGYTQVSTTVLPDFHRHASTPAATSRSPQKQALSSHSSYPCKKTSAAGSTVSDSGVEMVRVKIPSAGPSSDIIEPWMSVSNEHQYWIQPRPRVTSVSTGVQTEGEEKTASPASGSPRTSSSPQHPHAESEGCNGGQDNGKQEIGKKPRRRLPLVKSRPSKPQHTFKWDLKRNKLNKKIYKHKEKERITCKKKLELDAGCGGANPRLAFHLVPYGLEDDAGKSVTLEIEVEISRKTRMSMHSSTKIQLSVCVQEMKEGNLLAKHENIEQSIDVRRFFIPQFLTHECLKLSRCDQIEIQASAELIPHSEHPRIPTDSK